MGRSRKKSNKIIVRPQNIARDSLFLEPAFKPKVAHTGKVKKYKRKKKVNTYD